MLSKSLQFPFLQTPASSIPSQLFLGDRVRPYWDPAEVSCSFSRAQRSKFILRLKDHPRKASKRLSNPPGKRTMPQETQRKITDFPISRPGPKFSIFLKCLSLYLHSGKLLLIRQCPSLVSPPLAAPDWSNRSLVQHSPLQHVLYHSRTQAISAAASQEDSWIVFSMQAWSYVRNLEYAQ